MGEGERLLGRQAFTPAAIATVVCAGSRGRSGQIDIEVIKEAFEARPMRSCTHPGSDRVFDGCAVVDGTEYGEGVCRQRPNQLRAQLRIGEIVGRLPWQSRVDEPTRNAPAGPAPAAPSSAGHRGVNARGRGSR